MNTEGKTTFTQSANDLVRKFGSNLAIDIDYLALLHDREISPNLLDLVQSFSFENDIKLIIQDENVLAVASKIDKIIAQLCLQSDMEHFDELACDYASIYLNYSFRASPQESVWLDDEHLAYQNAMFQIREVYKKHGLEVKDWRIRSDDHLVCQMQFFSAILKSDRLDIDKLVEVGVFYDEHLYLWLHKFRERVGNRCKTEFYSALSAFTEMYFESLRDKIAELSETPRPSRDEVGNKIKNRKRRRDTHELKFMPGQSPSW